MVVFFSIKFGWFQKLLILEGIDTKSQIAKKKNYNFQSNYDVVICFRNSEKEFLRQYAVKLRLCCTEYPIDEKRQHNKDRLSHFIILVYVLGLRNSPMTDNLFS